MEYLFIPLLIIIAILVIVILKIKSGRGDALEQFPVAAIITTERGKISAYNQLFKALIGFDDQQIKQVDHWWELCSYQEDFYQQVAPLWYQLIRLEREIPHIDLDIHPSPDIYRSIRMRTFKFNGKQITWFEDLSEKENRIRALRRELLFIKGMIETIPIALFYRLGERTLLNDTAQKLLGYRQYEINTLDQFLEHLLSDEASDIKQKYLQQIREQGTQGVSITFRRGGREYHYKLFLYRQEHGEICTLFDLAHQQIYMEYLEHTREEITRFKNMVQKLPIGAVYRNQDTLILNASARRMIGVGNREMIDIKSWFELLYQDKADRIRRIYENDRKNGLIQSRVLMHQYRGEKRYIDFIPYRDHEDELWILYDITDKYSYQQKLEAANRAKNDFLANMSHEIRTPLNGILGFTQILQEIEDDDEKLELLDQIYHSGEILLDIISDILDLVQIKDGRLTLVEEQFSISNLMEQLISEVKEKGDLKGISIILQMEGMKRELLTGDQEKLKQILFNLLDNGIKFTHTGAVTLMVETAGEEGENCFVKFTVKDTGVGIPRENLEQIFEHFYQGDLSLSKRYEGTGLGLSIVNHLVTMMGGYIVADSEPGGGSSFSFELPFKIFEKSVVNSDIDREGVTILVAEDNPINQNLIVKILKMKSFNVDVARNGEEVLAKVAEQPYDLILMDIQMPKMSGYDATLQLRAAGNPVTIIALTAYAMERDQQRCFEVGMNDYLSKPVKPKLLFEKIDYHLRGRKRRS